MVQHCLEENSHRGAFHLVPFPGPLITLACLGLFPLDQVEFGELVLTICSLPETAGVS